MVQIVKKASGSGVKPSSAIGLRVFLGHHMRSGMTEKRRRGLAAEYLQGEYQ